MWPVEGESQPEALGISGMVEPMPARRRFVPRGLVLGVLELPGGSARWCQGTA